jgi:hypothetical protein
MRNYPKNNWTKAINNLIEASNKLNEILGEDWPKKIYTREGQTNEAENALEKWDQALLDIRSCMAPHTVIAGIKDENDVDGWRELGKREKYPDVDKLEMARYHYDEQARDYDDQDARECADLLSMLLKFEFFQPDVWFKKEDEMKPLYIKGAGVPDWLSSRYKEAVYAYIYGFNNASIAICRSIVEGIIGNKIGYNKSELKRKIEFYMNTFKDIKQKQAIWNTNKVNILANRILHDISKSANDNSAKEALLIMRDFIKTIY